MEKGKILKWLINNYKLIIFGILIIVSVFFVVLAWIKPSPNFYYIPAGIFGGILFILIVKWYFN